MEREGEKKKNHLNYYSYVQDHFISLPRYVNSHKKTFTNRLQLILFAPIIPVKIAHRASDGQSMMCRWRETDKTAKKCQFVANATDIPRAFAVYYNQ